MREVYEKDISIYLVIIVKWNLILYTAMWYRFKLCTNIDLNYVIMYYMSTCSSLSYYIESLSGATQKQYLSYIKRGNLFIFESRRKLNTVVWKAMRGILLFWFIFFSINHISVFPGTKLSWHHYPGAGCHIQQTLLEKII